MAYISQVTLPNGSVYDLKDKNAPNMIDFTNAEIDQITGLDDTDAEEYSNNIAQDVIENYIGTELCGVNQSVEDAINGLNSSIGIINGKIGNVTLPTTAQTITGAIAEHEEDISTLNDNLSTTISNDEAGVIAGSWTLRKRGNIVFLQIVNVSLLPSGSTSLGTIIPSQYRPISEAGFTILRRHASLTAVAVTIETTGELRLYNYGSALSVKTPFNQLLSWATE